MASRNEVIRVLRSSLLLGPSGGFHTNQEWLLKTCYFAFSLRRLVLQRCFQPRYNSVQCSLFLRPIFVQLLVLLVFLGQHALATISSSLLERRVNPQIRLHTQKGLAQSKVPGPINVKGNFGEFWKWILLL